MRKILLSLAVALAATSLPGPTSLPSVGPSYAATLDFDNAATVVQAKKKKRSKSTGKRFKIEEIGGVRRGKRELKVRTTVSEAGLRCRLELSYVDGESDTPDDITSDDEKNCVFRVDIPRRASAVGQATATLYVYDRQGLIEGTASTHFDVL